MFSAVFPCTHTCTRGHAHPHPSKHPHTCAHPHPHPHPHLRTLESGSTRLRRSSKSCCPGLSLTYTAAPETALQVVHAGVHGCSQVCSDDVAGWRAQRAANACTEDWTPHCTAPAGRVGHAPQHARRSSAVHLGRHAPTGPPTGVRAPIGFSANRATIAPTPTLNRTLTTHEHTHTCMHACMLARMRAYVSLPPHPSLFPPPTHTPGHCMQARRGVL